jgi:SAM-dependent methyltransferase
MKQSSSARTGDERDVGAWVNTDQAAGEHRVRHAELFDAEARLHERRFQAGAGVGTADHVLDIGCGTGRSTRDAGRAAVAGTVLGVDTAQAYDFVAGLQTPRTRWPASTRQPPRAR